MTRTNLLAAVLILTLGTLATLTYSPDADAQAGTRDGRYAMYEDCEYDDDCSSSTPPWLIGLGGVFLLVNMIRNRKDYATTDLNGALERIKDNEKTIEEGKEPHRQPLDPLTYRMGMYLAGGVFIGLYLDNLLWALANVIGDLL